MWKQLGENGHVTIRGRRKKQGRPSAVAEDGNTLSCQLSLGGSKSSSPEHGRGRVHRYPTARWTQLILVHALPEVPGEIQVILQQDPHGYQLSSRHHHMGPSGKSCRHIPGTDAALQLKKRQISISQSHNEKVTNNQETGEYLIPGQPLDVPTNSGRVLRSPRTSTELVPDPRKVKLRLPPG
ncbi:hypothetical protein M5689_020620 [Euphorbia peplus]|nr:hypothetical protein M5689_020620 [Euphorbia peplus]